MNPSAAELLRAAAGRHVVDEDGNEETITLLPPLSPSEFARLEASIPCPLPDDARELLSLARGFEGGPLESIDFSSVTESFMEEIFPHSVPIAHDGFGNYWLIDLTSQSRRWGPIFYLCHDPAVVIYQCQDVAVFVQDVLRLADPHESPIDDVHETHAMRVWLENPGAIPRDAALQAEDQSLREFAQRLSSDYFIVDLRAARIGDGFSWGRFGPQTRVARAGEERIFAYQTRSRLARLRSYFTGR